jgi:hypothetical protein
MSLVDAREQHLIDFSLLYFIIVFICACVSVFTWWWWWWCGGGGGCVCVCVCVCVCLCILDGFVCVWIADGNPQWKQLFFWWSKLPYQHDPSQAWRSVAASGTHHWRLETHCAVFVSAVQCVRGVCDWKMALFAERAQVVLECMCLIDVCNYFHVHFTLTVYAH